MREGQADALARVFDRHAAGVLGLAQRIVRDRSIAEEVAQETFLAVWRTAHSYSPERGSAHTWVLSIARHRAIDAVRRQATQTRLTERSKRAAERSIPRDSTQAAVIHGDSARVIQGALGTLPDEQRRAIELAYFAGLTHSEIAVELELPLGTVKGRLRMGLARMRKVLGPEEAWA